MTIMHTIPLLFECSEEWKRGRVTWGREDRPLNTRHDEKAFALRYDLKPVEGTGKKLDYSYEQDVSLRVSSL